MEPPGKVIRLSMGLSPIFNNTGSWRSFGWVGGPEMGERK